MKCEKDVMSGSNSSFIDYPMVATENETDGSQKVPHGANAKSTRKESLKSAIRMQGQMVRQNIGKKGKTYFVKFAETTENVNKFEILDASGQAQKVITDTRNSQGLTRSKRQIKTPKRLLDSDAFVQLKPSSKTSKNIKQTNPEPDIKTLQLPYITICKLSKNDLFVEIEVEPEFQLSPIEFIEEVNGRLKYGLSLSKEKNIVKDELEESTIEHNEQKQDIGGNEQIQDREEKEKRPRRKKKKKTAKQVDDLKDIPVPQIINSNNVSNETINDTDETMKELQENETPCLEPISDVTDEQTQTVQEDDDNEDADYDPTEEGEVEKTKPQKERKLKEETKPKRKYTKRKAYNQDNTHYTVVTNEEGKTVHKCKFCGLEVRLLGNMRDHVRTHTGEKPFQCETCGKRFGSQTNYSLHMKCHSADRPFVCDICGFAFKIKKQLKLHKQRHTSSRSKICQHCGQGFYSTTELRNHILRHSDEKLFKCEVCDKSFTQPSSLKRHKFLHTGDGQHQCHYCGAVFNRRDYFRSHLVKKHSVSEDALDTLVPNLHPGRKVSKRKFKCNFCGAEMQSGGNMRDHIRSHTGEKPFECEVCGKTFKSNNNLKGHMVVHSNERPYVCDICGFAFKQKGLLKIHRTRHNPDSSRFTCHICGKGFYSSTEVKKHIPSHTGEKKYECKICNRKFTQDSALARHRFVHTGSKPHMCEICGMTFVRKEHFRKHNEKFHSSDNTKVKTEIAHPSEIIVDIQGEATDATNNLIDKEMIYLQLDGSVYSVPAVNDSKGTDILYQAMEIPVQNTEIIIVTDSNELDRKIEYSEL